MPMHMVTTLFDKTVIGLGGATNFLETAAFGTGYCSYLHASIN